MIPWSCGTFDINKIGILGEGGSRGCVVCQVGQDQIGLRCVWLARVCFFDGEWLTSYLDGLTCKEDGFSGLGGQYGFPISSCDTGYV